MQLTTRTFATRIFAGIATLTLAGAAGLTAGPAADAATQACGSNCTTLVAEDYGASDVMTVIGSQRARGLHVTLAAAGQNSNQDFKRIYVGTVSALYQDGVVTSVVGLNWPYDDGYEYEYAPDGIDSGLCLGIAETAAPGTVVNLYTCNVDAETIWITFYRNSASYDPLMSGTNTSVTAPEVLTVGTLGESFTTSGLDIINHALVSPTQLWANESGVL